MNFELTKKITFLLYLRFSKVKIYDIHVLSLTNIHHQSTTEYSIQLLDEQCSRVALSTHCTTQHPLPYFPYLPLQACPTRFLSAFFTRAAKNQNTNYTNLLRRIQSRIGGCTTMQRSAIITKSQCKNQTQEAQKQYVHKHTHTHTQWAQKVNAHTLINFDNCEQ